jgi:HlyD family secretion protein
MNKKVIINAALFLVLLPAIILSFSFTAESANEPPNQEMPLYTVKEEPLTIRITEPGSITSSQSISVINEVRGTRNVIWVIPEGTKVKKDQLIVELDSSSLNDDKEDMEIQVSNADLAYIQAKENLEIVIKQGEADIKDSQMNLDFSKQDLEKYTKGEYIQKLRDLKADITLSQAQLERAEDRLQWSQKLRKEGYITETELQSDELTVQREQLKLESSQGALKLFEQYTHPKSVIQLERLIERRDFEMERTKHRVNSNDYEYKARLSASEVDLNRKKQKLEYILEQIELCKIKAPADGLVVYSSSQQNSSGRKTVSTPLQQGVAVKEREELIQLPVSTKMLAIVKLPETALNQIRKGMDTTVRVDALNSLNLTGTLKHIDPMPNPGSLWMNPNLKEYNSEIVINEEIKGLRPGMSCKVDILVKHFDSTIAVPVQCVVRENKQSIIYVHSENGVEKRVVKTGMDDGIMVQIISGLQVGEQALMTPPLNDTSKPEETHETTDSKLSSKGKNKQPS